VPQSLGVLFDFSVIDMVLMGQASRIGFFRSPGRRDRQTAARALAEVGMSAFARHAFGTLSGGERQLVLLARALAGDAELVFLDEPTAGLDLANEARVLRTVADLKRRGTTIVMTTHDPDHAVQLADSVLLMQGRHGHRFGSAEECLTDAVLSRLYGVPLQRIDIDTQAGRRSVLAKLHRQGATQ
jgi:iron complex transport system ATP-binding protein